MLKEHLDDESKPSAQKGIFLVSEVGDNESFILERHKGKRKRQFSPRVKRILDNGQDVHTRILRELYRLGLVISSEVDIPDNELFRGRADAVLSLPEKGKFILEMKSTNPKVFSLDTPLLRHELQLQLYLHYLGFKKGILLYENKATQELKEFVIEKDESEVRRIQNRFTRLKEILGK